MKKLSVALALAALAAAGAAPAFAQSSDTWAAGISSRNIRPFEHTPSTYNGGYSASGLRAFAMVPGGSTYDPAVSGGGSTGYNQNLHDDRW